MRRFRSRGRIFRSKPARHWVPAGSFGVETSFAVGTLSSSSLASATAQAGASFIDNNRATVYAIRGQVGFRNTSGTGIALVTVGIIKVPVTAGALIDTADFDPTNANNLAKPWMWLGTCYLMANNASVNNDAQHVFEINVRTKRVVSEEAIALIAKYSNVVAGATVVIVPNIRTLVGKLG